MVIFGSQNEARIYVMFVGPAMFLKSILINIYLFSC